MVSRAGTGARNAVSNRTATPKSAGFRNLPPDMMAVIAGALRPLDAARFAATSKNARNSVGRVAAPDLQAMAPRALAQYMYAMALLMKNQPFAKAENGWRPAQALKFAGLTFAAVWTSPTDLTLDARSGVTKIKVQLRLSWLPGIPQYPYFMPVANDVTDNPEAEDLLDLVFDATIRVVDALKDAKTVKADRVFLDVDGSGKFLKASFNDRDPRTTLARRLIDAIRVMPGGGYQYATVPISPEAGRIEIYFLHWRLTGTASLFFKLVPKDNFSATLHLAQDGTGYGTSYSMKTLDAAQYAIVIQDVATVLSDTMVRMARNKVRNDRVRIARNKARNNLLAKTRAATTIQAAWKAHRTRQANLRANSARPGYHLVAGKGAPFEVLRGPAGNRRTVAQKAEAARRHPTVARFNPRTNR